MSKCLTKPRQAVARTIVFRIDYLPGQDDQVTAWLQPDLSMDENAQPPAILTQFEANASFDQIRLREGNGPSDNGWSFSNILISEQSPFSQPQGTTFASVYPGLAPDGDANQNGFSNFFSYAAGADPRARNWAGDYPTASRTQRNG